MLSLTIVLAGCGGDGGGDGDEEIQQAAQQAIFAKAKDRVGQIGGSLVEAKSVDDLRLENVEQAPAGDDGSVRLTATLHATIELEEQSDIAGSVRFLPAGQATVEEKHPVSAQLIEREDGWRAIPDSVHVEASEEPSLALADRSEAGERAEAAVQALLTYNGDTAAYARAQRDFYTTDLAPRLKERTPLSEPEYLDEPAGFAWEGPSRDGDDDIPLLSVFEEQLTGCDSGFRAGTLKVVKHGPSEIDDEYPSKIYDQVTVSGRLALQLAGSCNTFGGRESRRVAQTLDYNVDLVRPHFGDLEGWFVTGLSLDPDFGPQESIYSLRD